MRKLCEFYDIKKCETHPHKPCSNEAVERTNRKIKDVLKTMVDPTTVDWDMVINDLQLTLNNTVNTSTGETPHFLLYGYQKCMPLTLLDNARPPKPSTNYCDYSAWRHKLTYNTVHKTRKAVERAQLGHKKFYDISAVSPRASIGSQVYVKRHVPLGPNIKV